MLENEWQIIKQARQGSAEHFGILYDHYIAPIYRFIFLKVSDKAAAEDITHEVFLRAWQNIGSYNDQGHPFSSWLYQIARNKVIDYYRTKRNNVSLENIAEDSIQVAPAIAENLDLQSSFQQVKAAISQLNEEQQNVIILRFIEEKSSSEIAEIIGKSEGAVRIIQHRALNKLRELLQSSNNILNK